MSAELNEGSAHPTDWRDPAVEVLAAIFLIALLTAVVGFGCGWTQLGTSALSISLLAGGAALSWLTERARQLREHEPFPQMTMRR
jgi:hypothetical protein